MNPKCKDQFRDHEKKGIPMVSADTRISVGGHWAMADVDRICWDLCLCVE